MYAFNRQFRWFMLATQRTINLLNNIMKTNFKKVYKSCKVFNLKIYFKNQKQRL
jgi:hypothetical protein